MDLARVLRTGLVGSAGDPSVAVGAALCCAARSVVWAKSALLAVKQEGWERGCWMRRDSIC